MKTFPVPKRLILLIGGMFVVPLTSMSAPVAGSPYYTDVANEYVQDATSDGMANVNMVLCIMNAMSPAEMLTKRGVLDTVTGITEVKYIALVDKNKCDSRTRADASNSTGSESGATSTPSYMTATVDITRGSGVADPMVGKIWMSLAEKGGTTNVSIKLTATTDPVTLPPYGRLRLDYVGYAGGLLQFNGFIDANGGVVSHVETGDNSSDVSLTLNAVDANTGNGVLRASKNNGNGNQVINYTFAYTSDAFARKVAGGSDMCFDRSKAHAQRSVWRYGVYDATSGARVDQAHPGFPLTATASSGLTGVTAGQKVFGFASYWGVNFGGMDPSLIPGLPDGQITAVTAIADGRPNNTTNYNLYKSSGKLIHWSQHETTLAAISGVPFNMFGEGCTLANGGNGAGQNSSPSGASCAGTNGFPNSSDFRNWVMQWDSALVISRNGTPVTGNFKVVGMQDCSTGNCMTSTFSSATPVLQGFKQMPINAWAEALGSLTIPLPAGSTMQTAGTNYHADSDPVYYYSQSTVLPSSASALTLYCLSNCPTHASLVSAANSGSPFAAPTNQQWGMGTAQESYSFGASGLLDSTASAVVAGAIGNPMWQGGINSGRMFTSSLANSGTSCPMNVTFCEPPTPTDYYTYQTGANQWNQSMWLTTSGGNVVSFDPPQSASFTVPSGAAYGSWAGKSVQLQFNGFGNLSGIPGNCVDPQTNATVNCTPSTRFVPAFALADGSALTLGSQAVLTKALDSELRLASQSCGTLNTATVTATLPTTLPNNPTVANDSAYIGSAPDVTGTPSVIDGVLQ